MGDKTGIEWTDATWNPVRGCSIVSPGCHNCYAMKQAWRFNGPGAPYEGLTKDTKNGAQWTGKIKLVPEVLDQPFRWKRPRRIFVNSMSDLFHEGVPNEYIAAVFGAMAASEPHTFQVLTKRPERALEWFKWVESNLDMTPAHLCYHWWQSEASHVGSNTWSYKAQWPLKNVWIGVSAEDQIAADQRIPSLMAIPAAKRFISCEPLLGPIRFSLVPGFNRIGLSLANWWVIVGGESGPKARPMQPNWVRDIRDQCKWANVPFFFKQWGRWFPDRELEDGTWLFEPVGKKKAGRVLDGETYEEYP